MKYKYIFKQHISCSAISGDTFCFRYFPQGFIFDSASLSAFINEENMYYVLAMVNSNVIQYILNSINPTLNIKPGDFESLPYIKPNNNLDSIVKESIGFSKCDYCSFETTLDFKKHPLI